MPSRNTSVQIILKVLTNKAWLYIRDFEVCPHTFYAYLNEDFTTVFFIVTHTDPRGKDSVHFYQGLV